MRYNFDEIIDRTNTNAENLEGFRPYMFAHDPAIQFPVPDDQLVRMWVADMEFAVAPEIREAVKERVDRKIFGYTAVYGHDYYDALSAWCRDRYGWSFPQEELTFSPGIIPALYELVGDLVQEDEKVLTVTPAYGFFLHAAEYNQRELVCSPLINDGEAFRIDLEDLEKKAADPKVKLLLWCNPHNPTGRVWTEEEAKQIAAVVEKNDLWIVSDEIHCDLLRNGQQHIPMGKIMPDYPKLITCMAASKTFNMAGLMFSNIIIRDEALRNTFVENDKLVGAINPLSLAANQAAYEKGWPWLQQLRDYLDKNFAFATAYIEEHMPGAKCYIPQSTYLCWVDFNACLGDVEDLSTFFAVEAGVLAEGGDRLFVGNAKGFLRLNLAMPREMIARGLERMAKAIEAHRQA